MAVTYDLSQLDKVRKRLDAAGAAFNGAKAKPLLILMGGYGKQVSGEAFGKQADPVTGRAWKGVSSLTLGSRPGGGGGGKTLYDTHALFNSIQTATLVFPTSESVSLGTNLIYARKQFLGGTIKPVNSKYLAIPLNREAARAGSARRWWAANQASNPFIHRSRSGKLLIFREKSDGKSIEPMFLLVSSVTLPARPYLGMGPSHLDHLAAISATYIEQEAAKAAA